MVGRLTLGYEARLPDDSDQVLVAYHAGPGPISAESLWLRASWSIAEISRT